MFVSFKLFIVSFCIGLIALCGDCVENKLTIPWTVALVDNLTHALIGCLSWLSVSLGKSTNVRDDKIMCREIVCCGLIASLIDLDHFLSAFSWKLAVRMNFFFFGFCDGIECTESVFQPKRCRVKKLAKI